MLSAWVKLLVWCMVKKLPWGGGGKIVISACGWRDVARALHERQERWRESDRRGSLSHQITVVFFFCREVNFFFKCNVIML